MMKKEIKFYLLGLATVALFSFTSEVAYTEFKPLKPTSTVVTRGIDSCREWVKKGYQIQTMTEGSSGRIHFVLVKYD